jgi:hypothetical protein
MYLGLHVKYFLFLSDCNETRNFLTDFSKTTLNIKFPENPSSGNQVAPYGQTDGRTDMTKLIVAFCNFTIALKNFIAEKLNESPQNIE